MISQNSTIGFIGLGAMGQLMARRLLSSGFPLVVYDHTSRKTVMLATKGAVAAPSVRQLARKAEVIISCLPNDEAVLSVYRGPEGVLACAHPGSIVIEMSTISPDTSRSLHRMGIERGLQVLDVAVSGSTPAAEQGSLTLLGGGDASAFDSCQPIFSAIAKQYFHMGPSGSGTAMKLVVNALLGVNMQAIAEAVAFGEKAGLNRELLLETLAKTAVIAPAHQGKLLRAEHDDYSPQFPLKLMNKDFRLILEKAGEVGAPMPATAAALQINAARTAVDGDQDFSIVIGEMERLAQVHGNSQPTSLISRLKTRAAR
ncbi:NAD(P)-dependent oxidoreductase [Candidatus Binatus sp.]|uniref:NAD(P)-dependent oxidoreductase n=1 Tax=Candidatus Binatus sp. TaxID=2811406 RepID=UPI003CC10F49